MALRACINVNDLPLCILLNDNPAWKGTPVAVTREEKPRSPILALNREAREQGLSVGMKYAQALALVPGLRARSVADDRINDARAFIVRQLSAFTPDVEPCSFDLNAFWTSVDGLRSLFASESIWAEKVRAALSERGFPASVVIGFTRFGTYAIARVRSSPVVFASRDEERAVMERSSIQILPLTERTKATLKKLDVRTVRQFVALPRAETARRLGREAGFLRALILSDDPLPIQASALKETQSSSRHLDSALTDLALLMQHVDGLLAKELSRAEAAASVISSLALTLRSEDGNVTTDLIRPASPTLRLPLLSRLIRLRLSSRQLSCGVEDISISSIRAKPSRAQEWLFSARGRDLAAGARTFASLRARFGNDSVVRAQLCDSHLPERSFKWVPLDRPAPPEARPETPAADAGAMVRRILFNPRSVPADAALSAPARFLVSGCWWRSQGKQGHFVREYSFQRTKAGTLWIYTDALTGTAWTQGVVD